MIVSAMRCYRVLAGLRFGGEKTAATRKLIFVFQQLLHVSDKADCNNNCGTRHSQEEKRHDNGCSQSNNEVHTNKDCISFASNILTKLRCSRELYAAFK
ncbi:hypothetical protein BH10ACI4_BH10ACI4_27910 [soil metagenome]